MSVMISVICCIKGSVKGCAVQEESLTCLVASAYLRVTTPMLSFSRQRNSCCPFPSWKQRASKTGLRIDLQPLSSLCAFLFGRDISKEIKEPWGLENFVLKYTAERSETFTLGLYLLLFLRV